MFDFQISSHKKIIATRTSLMTFASASQVGAFSVIVKLRVIFEKVRLKLYSIAAVAAQCQARDVSC